MIRTELCRRQRSDDGSTRRNSFFQDLYVDAHAIQGVQKPLCWWYHALDFSNNSILLVIKAMSRAQPFQVFMVLGKALACEDSLELVGVEVLAYPSRTLLQL